jgi:hypothetical protein
MKAAVFVPLALLTCVVARSDQSSLTFPDIKIEGPSFSLLDGSELNPPAFTIDGSGGIPTWGFLYDSVTKVVSRMPIIAPGEIDKKMPVKTPDPGTD